MSNELRKKVYTNINYDMIRERLEELFLDDDRFMSVMNIFWNLKIKKVNVTYKNPWPDFEYQKLILTLEFNNEKYTVTLNYSKRLKGYTKKYSKENKQLELLFNSGEFVEQMISDLVEIV